MQLQSRVTNILTNPASEWQVIAGEAADPTSLFTEYAGPLAAIPAVCRFIGFSIVGMSIPIVGGTYRVGIIRGLTGAIVSWVMTLVGVYIAAVIVEKLAPTFQSSGSTIQALKLVVYAYTPVWVAGVLNLIPALSALTVIAALYSIYLFYLGLPALMKTPPSQVIPYMAVAALVTIVVAFVLGLVTAAIAGVGMYGGM
jgi:Yip1 domain